MPSRKANYSGRQAGTEETQMTAKRKKWEQRAGGGGAIIIVIIILFTVGKRRVWKTKFQVAKHPNCSPPNGPSVPSIILSLAGYVKEWSHAALIQAVLRGLIPRLLNPKCFIREACLWCVCNIEDTGLSAGCQLGNYPALLPGAVEATEPTQPSVAQWLRCWPTRLIPWNAGLSYHSLVNDFIQAGWGHQRLCNKGAALRSKNSTSVCGSL